MKMLAIFKVFTVVCFLELETLIEEDVCCFKMSGTDYPVTQHCISEEQYPEW